MIPRRRTAGLIAGLLTATVAGAAAGLDRAMAQTRDPNAPAPQSSARTLPPQQRDLDQLRGRGFTTTVRPAQRRGGGDAIQPPAVDPALADPNADPDADPDLTAEEQQRPRTRRPIPVDGDLNWPPPRPQPVDGLIPQDSALPTDGADPNAQDQRTDREADQVEGPPAGHDPQAFAEDVVDPRDPRDPFSADIEIDPILDRRPARLARFEPYQPVGIKAGSFLIFPEAEFVLSAKDNIFRSSSNVRRDISFDVRPSMVALSSWRTHAMEFRATGLSTFHNKFPSEDDRAYTLEARGRVDITKRTNVEMLASHDRGQEKRGSINAASSTGPRSNVDTDRLAMTFNHRFNRVAIQLRGSLTETDYGDTTSAAGGFVNNDSRDTSTWESAARATWFFKPNLGIFSEYSHNNRDYKAPAADLIKRDSKGDKVSVGLTFGNNGQKLRGEVSIGHARQEFDNRSLPSVSGVVVDANLAWRVSGLTTVLLSAQSGVSESSLVGSGGAFSQSAGIELRHAFRRYLIGTAGLRYTTLDYEGVNLKEHDLTSLLGLEYFVNRNVTLFSRYQHTAYDSTDLSRNYNYDEVHVGVRVRH